MSEITRVRNPHTGEVEYRCEWNDNDGFGRERCFKSFRAAERYGLEMEIALFNEAMERITGR